MLLNLLFLDLLAWTQVEVVNDIGDVGHSICVCGLTNLLLVLRGQLWGSSLLSAFSELLAFIDVGQIIIHIVLG